MPANDNNDAPLFSKDAWKAYIKVNHIIFDWDDTLLASSFLSSIGYRLDQSESERLPEVDSQLRELEQSVIEVLEAATTLGDVHIITNAEAGWVQLSAKKFMPLVVPLLERVKVVSARSTYEPKAANSPVFWKMCAFQDTLAATVKKTTDAYKAPVAHRNVISFGDSFVERQALQQMTMRAANTHTKSVKFAERPSMEQLRRQLELVRSCMEYIVRHEGDLDLQLTVTVTPPSPPVPPAVAATDAIPHDDVDMHSMASPPLTSSAC